MPDDAVRTGVAGRSARTHVCATASRRTGVHVVLAGPDGSGKSTLAAALPDRCRAEFTRFAHLHWRPGLFPRPGATVRREQRIGAPHARPPFGRALSTALLLYYWLDFAVGGVVRVRLPKRRGALVVVERGWWDIAVDPARYRLAAMPRLVRLLGRFVPSPDLILLLEAQATVIYARKRDIQVDEIASQSAAWRLVAPARLPLTVLTGDADRVSRDARDAIACVRPGRGWVGCPSRAEPRWLVPRGPRRSARAGLRVYQPITLRAQAGWHAARMLAGAGVFRALPRVVAARPEVHELLASHLSRDGSFAVSASIGRAHRFVALLLDGRGRETAVAKIALDEPGRAQLEREVEALERFAPLLHPSLRAPTVLATAPGLVLYEAIPWRPRPLPWRLEPEVAEALGAFYAATGGAHGDCAPWNLLRTAAGWALVDWEDALESADPGHDLIDFFSSGTRLLGRPGRTAILRGMAGRGWVGDAVAAYAAGAGLERPAFQAMLRDRLEDLLRR